MGQLPLFLADEVSKHWFEQGYALEKHGILEEQVDDLVSTYATFTDQLPVPDFETLDAMMLNPDKLDELDRSADKQAKWHKYRSNHPFIFKPGGYTNRSLQALVLRELRGLEIEEDPKEYFHFLPDSEKVVRRQHKEFDWGPLPPELIKLYAKFRPIHKLGFQMLRNVMSRMEDLYPGLNNVVVTDEDLSNSPIRLAWYHPGQGEKLAGTHADKSWLTGQIAESHQGYRAKHPVTGKMQLLERDPEYAIVFPGALLNLDHVYPDSVIIPTDHDVLNVPVPNKGRKLHGENVARWAIIAFANSVFAGEVDKSLTHAGDVAEQIELSDQAVA